MNTRRLSARWVSKAHEKAHKAYAQKKQDQEEERHIRALLRADRSDEEQLAELNRRLGKGQGARKERARLLRRMRA